MAKIPLIVICGPTASGKTALAVKAAQISGGEIINADSMQIYKYMNIGTAKPTPEEQKSAKHHLIDFVEPTSAFSVAEYVPLAHKTARQIFEKGGIPILAGGTGLYINSVVNDVDFPNEDSNPQLRAQLSDLAEKYGNEYLVQKLSEFDPVSASRLHPNNLRRVIRAIEFYQTTGIPISQHQQNTKLRQSRYEPLMFMIDFDRDTLYSRINERVDVMFRSGLIDEVRDLLNRGCTKQMQSMQGIGYKETIMFLEGDISLDECCSLIKQNTRRYAKRQLTWFKREPRIIPVSPGEDITDKILKFIKI